MKIIYFTILNILLGFVTNAQSNQDIDQLLKELGYYDVPDFDTLVEYYDNGQMKYHYPQKKGQNHGSCIYWYENGQVKTKITFQITNENTDHPSSKRIGECVFYYKDGRIQDTSVIDSNEVIVFQKSWYKNGQIQGFTTTKNNIYESRYWYEDGSKSSYTKWIDGKPIYCHAYYSLSPLFLEQEGKRKPPKITCKLNNIEVVLVNGQYVDKNGVPQQKKSFRGYSKGWHLNGKKSSFTKHKYRNSTTKRWDENGKLLELTIIKKYDVVLQKKFDNQ